MLASAVAEQINVLELAQTVQLTRDGFEDTRAIANARIYWTAWITDSFDSCAQRKEPRLCASLAPVADMADSHDSRVGSPDRPLVSLKRIKSSAQPVLVSPQLVLVSEPDPAAAIRVSRRFLVRIVLRCPHLLVTELHRVSLLSWLQGR